MTPPQPSKSSETTTVLPDQRIWICACCHNCAEDESMPFDVSPPVQCGICGAFCSCQGCRAETPEVSR